MSGELPGKYCRVPQHGLLPQPFHIGHIASVRSKGRGDDGLCVEFTFRARTQPGRPGIITVRLESEIKEKLLCCWARIWNWVFCHNPTLANLAGKSAAE